MEKLDDLEKLLAFVLYDKTILPKLFIHLSSSFEVIKDDGFFIILLAW